MVSVNYPNKIEDLVVLGFRGNGIISFTIMPLNIGHYRLLVWPKGIVDPELFFHNLFEFSSTANPASIAVVNLTKYRSYFLTSWNWSLVRTSVEETPLHDFGRAALGTEAVASGTFTIPTSSITETRFIVWSCFQPYSALTPNSISLHKDAADILEWYALEVREFKPHLIWGAGDTSYSDGTESSDFSNEVYDKGSWYLNQENVTWLRNEYRRMYRHFWSLKGMKDIMAEFPHVFIWDDHEIHDGWGSEGKDFHPGNLKMFEIAKEVASEFILNAGPRLRFGGLEAQQAYVLGPVACFLFDTRSVRNYTSPKERLISNEQFEDFVSFLEMVRGKNGITHLIINTSVPFVGLREGITKLVSSAPDLLNDHVISGIRDDVRDGWTSPGNIETLTKVLFALRTFMLGRPDVGVANISGDIHVANAFEILVPGANRPIYQITSSAITNRQHPSGIVGTIAEIGDSSFIEGVGDVRRLWDTVTDPNVLFVSIGQGRARFTLKVWNKENPGSTDLILEI